jgi:hypothetical protein
MAMNSSERGAAKKVALPEACFLCLVSVLMLLMGGLFSSRGLC